MCDFPKDDDKKLEIIQGQANDMMQALLRLDQKIAGLGKPNTVKAKGAWTVAVFMIADDTLRPFAERDLQELAKASAPDLRVLAQVHWQKGWRGEYRKIDTSSQFRKYLEPTTGAAFDNVTNEFARFLARVQNDIAASGATSPHRLMVVLWGHAHDLHYGGLGDNGMTMHEVKSTIDNVKSSGLAIDILGFDACETSSIDAARALQGAATRIIGSQIAVPFSGWPYHLILRELAANTGMGVDDLATVVIEQYYESYRPPRVTLTMVDGTTNYDGVSSRFKDLVADIAKHLASEKALFPVMQEVFHDVKRDHARPIMDLRDFCECLIARLAPSTVSTAVKSLLTGTANAVRVLLPGPPYSGVFVKGHERRGPGVEGLHGLACAPYVVTDHPGWTDAWRKDLYGSLGWPLAPFWVEPPVDHHTLPVNVPPLRGHMLNAHHQPRIQAVAEQLRIVVSNLELLRNSL